MSKIVLATTSIYKQQLFERLHLNFCSIAADIDESPRPDEDAQMVATRLAREKALKVAESETGSVVIGADQCAQCDQQLVFKPGSHDKAVADLLRYSGNQVEFYTAVCVLTPDEKPLEFVDRTLVHFRMLNQQEIENYLHIEQPYDCAGAFKAEGLGISLFRSLETSDPTAIVGLPLIQLSQTLRDLGFDCYSDDVQANNSGSSNSVS